MTSTASRLALGVAVALTFGCAPPVDVCAELMTPRINGTAECEMCRFQCFEPFARVRCAGSACTATLACQYASEDAGGATPYGNGCREFIACIAPLDEPLARFYRAYGPCLADCTRVCR